MKRALKDETGPVDVLVMGHILNEKIIFPDKAISQVLGSPAAYTSVCMAKLGTAVGIVTKIGRDFPRKMLRVFDDVGVDTRGIGTSGCSTNNELIYDEDGYKTLRYSSKADPLLFADIPAPYKEAKIVYVCPMDLEIGRETVKDLAALQKTMAVDLGGYGGGTSASHPQETSSGLVKSLCRYFTIVKASIEDIAHIFGGKMDEKAAGRSIIQWGAGICAVTLGEKGSFVATKQEERYVPAFRPKVVVDQTGAGDCYAAGMLAHFLKNGDAVSAAIYGTASASYAIERSGGVVAERMPDFQEVERRARIIQKQMNSETAHRGFRPQSQSSTA